jgi:outer membrane protein OmpA-like peptidoglycan-associated protein
VLLIAGAGAVLCQAQANELADYDRDGVINVRDKCQGTEISRKVDQFGCALLVVDVQRIMLNIPFKHGSAYIHPNYYSGIESLATELKRYPQAKLTLEGHASATGSSSVNQTMSMARAKRVAGVLIELYNIAPTRIKLVTEQDTQRRVVAYIKRHKFATHNDYLN